MIEVKILKAGQQTHGARFATQAEVDAWIAKQEAKPKAWGHLKDRWLREEQVLAEGKALVDAENTRVVQNLEGDVTEYFFSKEYTIEQADISAQVAQEQAIAQKFKDMRKGQELMVKFSVMNDAKGLNPGQFRQMAQDLAVTQTLLLAGNLAAAKEEILAIPADGVRILQADKDAIVAEIDAYLGA